MKHPEILLLPLLMLADYFLTLIAAIQQGKKYSDHFKVEHYELNPTWQASVAQRRWFNPKQILVTACFSAAVILLVGFGDLPERIADGLSGCVLILFAMVLARHVNNLAIFRYIARHPDQVSGQVTMRHAMSLWLSLFHYCAATVPIALIALFSGSAFAVGGCCAGMLLLGWHVRWIERAKRNS